jgi:hypothetical protein
MKNKDWNDFPKKIVVDGIVFNMKYFFEAKYGCRVIGIGYTTKSNPISASISADSYIGFINNAKNRLNKIKKIEIFC